MGGIWGRAQLLPPPLPRASKEQPPLREGELCGSRKPVIIIKMLLCVVIRQGTFNGLERPVGLARLGARRRLPQGPGAPRGRSRGLCSVRPSGHVHPRLPLSSLLGTHWVLQPPAFLAAARPAAGAPLPLLSTLTPLITQATTQVGRRLPVKMGSPHWGSSRTGAMSSGGWV